MIDVDDTNGVVCVPDLVHDAVCPYPRRVQPAQVAAQGAADTMWVLEKGTQHEVEHRGRDPLGEALDRSPSRPGYDEIPRLLVTRS
jgi:hypothetical protein